MQTICHEPPRTLTEAQEVIYIQIEKPYFSGGGGGLLHDLPSLPTVVSFHRYSATRNRWRSLDNLSDYYSRASF